MFRVCQPMEGKASLSCTDREKIMLVCKSSGESAINYLQCSVSCSTLLWQDCYPGKKVTSLEDNCSSQRYSVHKRKKKILVNVLSRDKRKSEVTLVEMDLTPAICIS